MPHQATPTRPFLPAAALAAFALAPAAARAQSLELPQPSPAASVTQRVGLTDFSVAYSSPGVKGRKIFGKLVPYGKLWRTGANKATRFEASEDFTFGGVKVKKGAYALFTKPTESGWTVILNAETEQWGAGAHDPAKDVASVKAESTNIPKRERLAFIFSDSTDSATRLDLEWDTVRVSVPITVATKDQVMGKIGRVWRTHLSAARYLQGEGDLKGALQHVDRSLQLKKTWRNHWVKAQILKDMKRVGAAKKQVKKALAKGDDSGAFKFYSGRMKDALKSWK